MCGIVAIVSESPTTLEAIAAMTETLIHRGPDEEGTVVLPEDGVALGMRRLSIVDLEGGQQPMWDECGRHCVVFNGEIYNATDLRTELEHRHGFATDHSDTEVLVHGFEEWGHGLFERLNGMFAVAIWDRQNRQLVIARDRTGEKPLYVGKLQRGYAIASELKALLRHPELRTTLDIVAIDQYLAFDYVLGPRTILEHVTKLSAGHYASVTCSGYRPEPFWAPQFERIDAEEQDLVKRLDRLLDESVARRMVADVPIGLFLSGGLDSTTVGWYMRRHSEQLHSFSIGFEDGRFDESPYAKYAARALGTTHHLELFSQDRVLDLVPRVAEVLDEPMGDQSIFPTFLLSQFTRQHVKVALGGDGSDELLMGYKAYLPLKVSWAFDTLPEVIRRAVAASALRLPTHIGSLPLRGVQFARRLGDSPAQRLLCHLGSFKGNATWILAPELREALTNRVTASAGEMLLDGCAPGSAANETVAAYLRGYLQEDILVKIDRASMAASLEVRTPFLDPNLIDFLLGVPASMRLRRATGKFLLRRLMRGRIPDEIIDRPKMGFGVPLNTWLRESLAPMVHEYLDPQRLCEQGLFDVNRVSALVHEHMAGSRDRGNEIWLLLQFELWRERWLGERLLS